MLELWPYVCLSVTSRCPVETEDWSTCFWHGGIFDLSCDADWRGKRWLSVATVGVRLWYLMKMVYGQGRVSIYDAPKRARLQRSLSDAVSVRLEPTACQLLQPVMPSS